MRVSVSLPDYRYLLPPDEGSLHGAFLATTRFLHWVANEPAFDGLEVFLPPGPLCDRELMQKAAQATLLPESRGKGRLSFYLIHHLPEVWADGGPRILRSVDPTSMARDRYLRDAFAQGPMALSVDSHTMASHEAQGAFKAVIQAEPAPFDSLQCLSPSMREHFRLTLAALGCEQPPFRLDVIGRPVDTTRFRPPTGAEKAAARERYGIPPNARVAIFHSRVGPYSKADMYPLVQAFAEVCGADDWLIVSGTPTSDNAYDTLRGWLEAAGVTGRTRLLGACAHDEVPSRLWASDFFVLPCDNVTEGIGIATVEALAAGLPAVVSDWDGMRVAVRDTVNGFLIPTYWVPASRRMGGFSPYTPHLSETLLLSQCIVVDEQALADRMRELFHDGALRARLGEQARQDAMAFEASAIQRKLIDLFREQLDEAVREPEASRERRRLGAERLGLPLDYERTMVGQATRALQADDRIELVKRELLEGRTLPVYEEVGLLASPAAITKLLQRLVLGPATFGELAGECGAYAVGVLLKRGAIRLVKQLG